MEKPKVSIIVPVYNVEQYIERCAVSLFEQTYSDIEYVFVNDCTPDHSVDVLKRVLSRYPQRSDQVKIINHDHNRGIAATRNTALDNCTGDFVCYADSDDLVELNAVELLVNRQMASNADIVTGMALMQTPNDQILLPHPHYNTKEEMVLDMMQLTINHALWRRLIRKSLYDEFQIKAKEGVNCGEDCLQMTQLAYYASSFSFVDEVVYHYDCTRDDSYMTSVNREAKKKRVIDDIKTADLIIDFFKDKEQVYYDEANRVAAKYIKLILKNSAKAGDFALFDDMRTRLKSFDKKYWNAIGWDKSVRRVLSQNYHLRRVVHFFDRVYNKILSFRYK